MVLSAFDSDLGNMEISPFNRELPLLKALPVPFWNVTIAREMRQFNAALGLTVDCTAGPSVNIVASIMFGRTSFKAVVRRELGDVEFRNLRLQFKTELGASRRKTWSQHDQSLLLRMVSVRFKMHKAVNQGST